MQNCICLIHTSDSDRQVLDTKLDQHMPPQYEGKRYDSVKYFHLPLKGRELTRLYEALADYTQDPPPEADPLELNLFPEKPDPEESTISPYFTKSIPLAKAFFKDCD